MAIPLPICHSEQNEESLPLPSDCRGRNHSTSLDIPRQARDTKLGTRGSGHALPCGLNFAKTLPICHSERSDTCAARMCSGNLYHYLQIAAVVTLRHPSTSLDKLGTRSSGHEARDTKLGTRNSGHEALGAHYPAGTMSQRHYLSVIPNEVRNLYHYLQIATTTRTLGLTCILG